MGSRFNHFIISILGFRGLCIYPAFMPYIAYDKSHQYAHLLYASTYYINWLYTLSSRRIYQAKSSSIQYR